ncbi:MAG: hypothetical protein GXP19_07510 [Gammaproteobacteria bacterium]|nr:hypothetical protein [Gammaproteobacteria bacterium]
MPKNAQLEAVEVDTFDGKLHVEWDPTAAVTPIGQLKNQWDWGGFTTHEQRSCQLITAL